MMSLASPRVALYGGSFDPVHDTHLSIARAALDHLALDELWWVPAGMPPQKARQPAPAADRAAMIALAIDGEPRFRLERCELERSGVSYTIDTVALLQQRLPSAEWFLLLGGDQCANLPTWRGWQEIVARVTLVVAGRLGAADACNPVLERQLLQLGRMLVRLPVQPTATSSTAVRAAVAAGGDISGMVPAAVQRYIAERRLYRATS